MTTFISSRCADHKSVLADLLFMEVRVWSGENFSRNSNVEKTYRSQPEIFCSWKANPRYAAKATIQKAVVRGNTMQDFRTMIE